MDKNILAKRKAQKLAREGHVRQAVEEMQRALGETEVDPYDHVYLGDLLIRLEERDGALLAWNEAVRSYERAGLYRNAIAICKKILRLDGSQASTHHLLGDLYLREGLAGEAVPHLLAFLEAHRERPGSAPEFNDVLDRIAALPGLPPEVVLRLSELYAKVEREDRAALLLEELAAQVAARGTADLAAELRDKAQKAEAAHLIRQSTEGAVRGSTPPPERSAPPAPVREPEDAGVDAEEVLFGIRRETPAPAKAAPPVPSVSEEEARSSGLQSMDAIPTASASPAFSPFLVEHFPLPTLRAEDPEGNTPDVAELPPDPSQHPDEGAVSAGGTDRQDALDSGAGFESEEPAKEASPPETPIQRAQAHSWKSLIDRADSAVASGSWEEARTLYEQALHDRPLDRSTLDRLLWISRQLEDRPGLVRYLTLWGDSWIEEGDLEEAQTAFFEVLALDPSDATALRRIARFREMGLPAPQAEIGSDGQIDAEVRTGEPFQNSDGEERGPEQESADEKADEKADAIGDENANKMEKERENEQSREETPADLALHEGSHLVVSQSSPAIRTEEWADLGALLEEFQAGVKKQIGDCDYESHYDLALSHHEMGLLDEALGELDLVLECSGLPEEKLWQAQELKGRCLMELCRFREAIFELRQALESATGDRNQRRGAQYQLGCALEAAGEWQEAGELFEQLFQESPDFLDLGERLRSCREHAGQDLDAEAA